MIDFQKAETYWRQLDKKYCDPITSEIAMAEYPRKPEVGWIRACRLALFLSQDAVAAKLGVSQQAYKRFEKSEAAGSLTLNSLSKAAEALDCELVYFLRPRQRRSFSSLIWARLQPEALRIYQRRNRGRPLQPVVLARIALSLLQNPEFRRRQRWSRSRT